MRTKSIFTVSAVAAMVLTASLALAGPGGMGRGAGGSCGDCAGSPALQLSPEKQAAFQKLHEAFYAKTAQLRAAVMVKRAELNAAAVAPNPDQAKIESLAKEIGEMHAKLLVERTQFRIQVAKEIGPEAAAACGRFGHRGGPRGGF